MAISVGSLYGNVLLYLFHGTWLQSYVVYFISLFYQSKVRKSPIKPGDLVRTNTWMEHLHSPQWENSRRCALGWLIPSQPRQEIHFCPWIMEEGSPRLCYCDVTPEYALQNHCPSQLPPAIMVVNMGRGGAPCVVWQCLSVPDSSRISSGSETGHE